MPYKDRCWICGKVSFPSEVAASQRAHEINTRVAAGNGKPNTHPLHAYQSCETWHLTSKRIRSFPPLVTQDVTYLEGVHDGWDLAARRHRECRHCGRRKLRWKHLQSGWHLIDSSGTLHVCDPPILPEQTTAYLDTIHDDTHLFPRK